MEIQILIQGSEEYLETVSHIKHSFYIACSVENLDFIFFCMIWMDCNAAEHYTTQSSIMLYE